MCRAEKEKVMGSKDKKYFGEKFTKEGYLTPHPIGNFDGESYWVTSSVKSSLRCSYQAIIGTFKKLYD